VSTHAAVQARAEWEAAQPKGGHDAERARARWVAAQLKAGARPRPAPTAGATAAEARFRAAVTQAVNALLADCDRHPGTLGRMPTDVLAFVCCALERDEHRYQAAARQHAAALAQPRPLHALPNPSTGKEAAA
jgi:hypothetical protein